MAIQGGVVLAPLQAIGTYVKTISTFGPLPIYLPSIDFGSICRAYGKPLNGDAFGHPTGGNFGILYPESTLAHRYLR